MKHLVLAIVVLVGFSEVGFAGKRSRSSSSSGMMRLEADGLYHYYNDSKGNPISPAEYDRQLAVYNAWAAGQGGGTRTNYGSTNSTTYNYGHSNYTNYNYGGSNGTIYNYGDSNLTIYNYGRGRTTVYDSSRSRTSVYGGW